MGNREWGMSAPVIALREAGTGNGERGTVDSQRVSAFRNVLTNLRSAIPEEEIDRLRSGGFSCNESWLNDESSCKYSGIQTG